MFNKLTIVGRVGKDAVVRYTQNGQAVANFSVATSETWKDQSGERHEETQWFDVTMWGKMAEAVSPYILKGQLVLVSGPIKSRQYEAKDGSRGTSWTVTANELKLLGSRNDRGSQTSDDDGGRRGTSQDDSNYTEDDIPF